MTLLAEYAITPDVFDCTSYSSEELCGLRLEIIKEALLQEGVVRNLRNGNWARLYGDTQRPWHPRSKELLKKLAVQNRLVIHSPVLSDEPTTDSGWCDEALASHGATPLNGVIVTDCIAEAYRTNTIVSPIHRLTSAPWWQRRSPSIRLRRTIIDYKANLYQVLKHSNSIMFIDPHVDPSKPRYRSFIELVKEAGHRTPVPKIEVHRVCSTGSGPSCRILNTSEIKEMFQSELLGSLTTANLTMEVFIWDDFHDRYLISNLVGIGMLNGFDTSSAKNAMSTWTRLGRDDRDDVQREFDPASNRHVLRGSFTVP